ncbi:MAG: ERAP1-like C-terminal domain-containing protein, partial [Candidatus Obscuribacterales bacterium]|nr:ERAP1-like C-terminal domain-containing protein [Candidatus Obscuribacterales bacterium]
FGRHALWTDSLKSTRPIHANVKSPEQAMEMFDDITYVKGSAVLRMLERYVGQDVFQRGVQLYMKTHAFKTATTEDLWWAVATTSSKPIPEMMRSWIYQPGYPLISVSSTNAGNDLHLSQQRYFLDPPVKPTTTKWMVPVAFKWLGKDGKTSVEMLDQTERNITCPKVSAPVFVNADAVGFYRVSYSKEQLEKVEESLYTDLTPNERYCLLTDMASLTASFNQPVSEELRLTKLCKAEEDPFVVPQVASRVAQWRKFVVPAVRPAYQQYIQYMLLPQKDRLGWQAKLGESDLVQQARSGVLSVLGTYGQHQPTIAEARALFAKYRADRTSIEPNVVNVVLNIVSYNGSAVEYEQIKQLWQTAKTPESEETDLMMLTNFQKPELIQKTLALCLSNQIQTQDRPRMWSSLLANDSAKRMVWSFVKLHWPEIVKKCPPMALDRVAASCRSLDTAVDEKDLRLFFATHKTAGMESEVSRMLESVHLAVRFREKNGAYINNYMRDKQWQK